MSSANSPEADAAEGRRDHSRLYGRAAGKPLSGKQRQLVEKFLPGIDLPEEGPVDLDALMPDAQDCVLEIGFGGGEHLAGQAARAPESLFIGIEPFLNGVGKALVQVSDAELENVRLHRGDARNVMPRLPEDGFDRIYLLFPDPWPKSRHAKRRFVQPETRDQFARLLKPGARLRIATDVKSYATHCMAQFEGDARFEWTARKADDWRIPPADHIQTRYETKNLGDCRPVYMDWVRV